MDLVKNISPLDRTDLVMLIGSLAISAFIGFYFTNKNKSMDSYMLGDKRLTVIPVALSLMTSSLSGLSILGASSEFYYQGPSYSFIAMAILVSGPITAYTILPVFYRMNELSLYKYLEQRYSRSVKYIVTSVFIVQFTFYNSVVLYVPSMALQEIIGIPKLYSILLIGLMCVLYSGIGGLKAVVWTDLFQAISMFLAIFMVGLIGTYDAGGFGQVFENCHEQGRLDLDDFFSMDPTVRHTLLGVLLGSTIKHVYLIGANQVQIQRVLSLPSLRDGQRAFLFCSIFAACMNLLCSYMGVILSSAYKSCDPYLSHEIPRRDAIVVHYVAHRLRTIPGFRGIFVAGIFSATLSTLSSFTNSMAGLAIEDFIKPLRRKLAKSELSDSAKTWLAKILATLFGLVCVLLAYVVDKANSRLLQATTTLFGAVGVPFLASFALGIFTRYTNSKGIYAGLSVTLTMGIYITVYQIFFAPPLEPSMFVYYDDRCAKVFNMTMSSSLLPSLNEISELDTQELEPNDGFRIEKISYMILPAIQFLLMIIISSIVSLLTGGWNQQVDDKYLVSFLHSNHRSAGGRASHSLSPNGANQQLTDNIIVATNQKAVDSLNKHRKRKIAVASRYNNDLK